MAKKLVYGVGINDASYEIYSRTTVQGRDKITWRCPFYVKWSSMLGRCYSPSVQLKQSTYIGCTVVEEWYRFSIFKAWMETQDWEGNNLDKDLLIHGNKIYGPKTCVFIDRKVNSFIVESGTKRGEWPIGVTFNKPTGKFMARCWNVTTGKCKTIGRYTTPEEAHQAWLSFKLEQAYILAQNQTDVRVAEALICRYKNYANSAKTD